MAIDGLDSLNESPEQVLSLNILSGNLVSGTYCDLSMIKRPINRYDHYHAHVYFDGFSTDKAASLCQKAGELFGVKIGRVHQKPVGPHPCRSCQLAFDKNQFEQLIPWLEKNREDFTVLVHGLTGNDLADHTEHASWLGKPVPLNLLIFD